MRTAVLLLTLFMGSATAVAAEPLILRTTVQPTEAWIGQRTILVVDVLARDGWAQIPKIGTLEIPGAYVMRTDSQGTRLQETIAGDSYTGQRYELSLYPQRSGRLEIPTLPVDVTITTWGASAGTTTHRTSTPAAALTCKTPPGAEGMRGLISTTELTANQSWERNQETPKVGDAIQRSVTLHATDVSGMAFVPLAHPAIEGVGIYPGEPTVKDSSARGSLAGTRVETVTYILEQPGQFQIPTIELHWWNVAAHSLERIELPGMTLHVAGTPADSTTMAPPRSDHRSLLLWAVAVVVTVVAAVAGHRRQRLLARWAEWRSARHASEAARFRRARRALQSGDATQALRETMRWLDGTNGAYHPARLDLFLQRHGDPDALRASMQLTHAVTSGADRSANPWDGAGLSRSLARARARWRRSQRSRQHTDSLLPRLND